MLDGFTQPPWHAPAANWSLSSYSAGKIKEFEGLRLTRYQDAIGIWTIGYGHATDDPSLETITLDKAELLFASDINICGTAIRNAIRAEISQGQFDALTDFTFNCGVGNFQRSGLIQQFNTGNLIGACATIQQYNKAGGRALPGLTARRQWECQLIMAA